MRKSRNPRRHRRSSRNVWLAVGLAAFIAVDIFLVALALGWGREQPTGDDAMAQREAEVSSEPVESTSQESSTASPTPSEEVPAPEIGRNLSVVSANVAWRSDDGPCSEPGSIELTVDGGQTWGTTYPSDENLGRPLWLSGTDYTTLQVAFAAGEECTPEGAYTSNSGASWVTDVQVVENAVFVDPNDPTRLVWTGEAVEGPCEDISNVAVSGGAATVACSDGSLWRAEGPSGEWVRHAVEGVRVVGGSPDRRVAAVETTQCDGLGLVELDEDSFQMINCLPADPEEAIAIDLSGSALWLWIDDEVFISEDGGRNLN